MLRIFWGGIGRNWFCKDDKCARCQRQNWLTWSVLRIFLSVTGGNRFCKRLYQLVCLCKPVYLHQPGRSYQLLCSCQPMSSCQPMELVLAYEHVPARTLVLAHELVPACMLVRAGTLLLLTCASLYCYCHGDTFSPDRHSGRYQRHSANVYSITIKVGFLAVNSQADF
jgi:hypothetical protein